jgi:Xaa-Pro aminopeptidase
MTPQETRLLALREAMDGYGMAAVVLSRPQHFFYFTGVLPGPQPALLVVTTRRLIAVAPKIVESCETFIYSHYDIQKGWNVVENASFALSNALDSSVDRGNRIGIEAGSLLAAFLPAVMRVASETLDLTDLLWRLRRVKDESELSVIEKNVAGNDRVHALLQSSLKPGMSEIDAWGLVYHAMSENAGGPVTLECDLASGKRGEISDGKAGPARLAAGDALFVDIYSATQGYYADTTRVFTLGEPDAKQREIHGVLLEAIAAGEAMLRPGVPADQVDAAVRGTIAKAGYGEYFPHHSGHAYGLFQQEKPYFIPAEKSPVEQGMVMTLEPGIYIPGWGGMRIERNYVIGADGLRILDKFPTEIAVCAAG